MGMIMRGDDSDSDWEKPAWSSGASWSTSSKKDPRFNMSGYSSGIWSAQAAMDDAIRAKAKALKIAIDQIPDDIEIGAWKD